MMSVNARDAAALLERSEALYQAGQLSEAISCLEQAAEIGLPEAKLALARTHRRSIHPNASTERAMTLLLTAAESTPLLWSEIAELHFDLYRDLPTCIDYLKRAREAGSRLAAKQLAVLTAGQDEHLALFLAGAIPEPAQELCSAPLVRTWHQIIPDQICRYLIEKSASMMRPSLVVHPGSGQLVKDPVRTSRNWSVGFDGRDVVVNMVLSLLAACCDRPLSHGERLSVLQYSPGEEYKSHYDYLNLDKIGTEAAAAGQRTDTAILYLNDDFSGGQTEFRRLGLNISPTVGSVLHFRNIDQAGAPDPLTLHAGLPVLDGTKWAATLWIREHPYRYPH